MKRKLLKILFTGTILFIFICNMNAVTVDYKDDNLPIYVDGEGNLVDPSGPGGPGKPLSKTQPVSAIKGATMVKFSLVNETTLEVESVIYYSGFSESSTNPYAYRFKLNANEKGNKYGANGVCGFISNGEYVYDCDTIGNSSKYNIKGIKYGYGNWFYRLNDTLSQAKSSEVKKWMQKEHPEREWGNLYQMLIDLDVCSVDMFDLNPEHCSSVEALYNAFQDRTLNNNQALKEYAIIAEPVYVFRTNSGGNGGPPYIYSTLKGMATLYSNLNGSNKYSMAVYIDNYIKMFYADDVHGLINKNNEYNNNISSFTGNSISTSVWGEIGNAKDGVQYNIWSLGSIIGTKPVCQIVDTDNDGIPEIYGRFGQVLNTVEEMDEDCSCFIDRNNYYLEYWKDKNNPSAGRADPVTPEEWQEVCEPTDKFVCPPKEIDYDDMIDDCNERGGVGDMKDPEICRILNREYENNLDNNYITDYGNSYCKIYNRETLQFTFMDKETALAGQSFKHHVTSEHLNNKNLSTLIVSQRQATSIIDYEKWKKEYDAANDKVLEEWNNLKYWEALYNWKGNGEPATASGGGCSGCSCDGPDHPTNEAWWGTSYYNKTESNGSIHRTPAYESDTGSSASCDYSCCCESCTGEGEDESCSCECGPCCGSCSPAGSADLGIVSREYGKAISRYEGALDNRDRLIYALMDCNMLNNQDSVYTSYRNLTNNSNYHVSNDTYHPTGYNTVMYNRFLEEFPNPKVEITYEEQDYSYEYDLSEANLVRIKVEKSEPYETKRNYSDKKDWIDYCGNGIESEEACENDLSNLSNSTNYPTIKYWLCSGTGGICRNYDLNFPVNTLANIEVSKDYGYYQDEEFYTQVYTGVLRNSPSSLGYWMELEDYIWPVGMLRKTGEYDINVSYYDLTTDKNRVLTFDSGDLLCRYQVVNDLSKFDCDDSYHKCYDCVGSEDCYPGDGDPDLNLGVYFRTIDLNDVFPNSQYSPSTTGINNALHRGNIGKNWINEKEVIEEIQELGDKVYTTKPIQYKVTLTPSTIKSIQKSNKLKEGEGGYLDYSLINCGSSLHCESNFLKNELKEILGNKYEDLYKTNTRIGLYDYRR